MGETGMRTPDTDAALAGRPDVPEGVRFMPGFLSMPEQQDLVRDIESVLEAAPPFIPRMPGTGKAMSVRMTNCGKLGWVTDKEQGYRYQAMHPVTGVAWPSMPAGVLRIWEAVSRWNGQPEACLINIYDGAAKMGLHQDRDEEDLTAPVVSVSLGDDCRFRIGGTVRGGATASLTLHSGDVIVLEEKGRLRYHGVDRVFPGTSPLDAVQGRWNLTMRRVTKPVV